MPSPTHKTVVCLAFILSSMAALVSILGCYWLLNTTSGTFHRQQQRKAREVLWHQQRLMRQQSLRLQRVSSPTSELLGWCSWYPVQCWWCWLLFGQPQMHLRYTQRDRQVRPAAPPPQVQQHLQKCSHFNTSEAHTTAIGRLIALLAWGRTGQGICVCDFVYYQQPFDQGCPDHADPLVTCCVIAATVGKVAGFTAHLPSFLRYLWGPVIGQQWWMQDGSDACLCLLLHPCRILLAAKLSGCQCCVNHFGVADVAGGGWLVKRFYCLVFRSLGRQHPAEHSHRVSGLFSAVALQQQ